MKKIQKAKETATRLHERQFRKDKITPFIVHPSGVATLLEKYTDDEDIICAGWLHDTLEDVIGYNYEQLEKDFGEKVAEIVKEVSEDKDPSDSPEKSIATWRERKLKYMNLIKNDSHEAVMVSCADKIHNLRSLIELYKKEGDEMWGHFNAPEPKVESEMWYYLEMLDIFKNRINNDIIKEYEKVIKEAQKTFES